MAAVRVNPQRRREAMLHERDRRRIEVIGERVCRRIAAETTSDLLRAFQHGADPVPIVRNRLETEFTPLIQQAMVAGHLQGRLRTARVAAIRFRKRRTMSAYDEALDWLRKRMALSPDEMEGLIDSYGNEAARVTRGLDDAVEQRVQQAMERIIEGGAHTQEAIATLRQELIGSGSGPMSPALMETLVRTNTSMAYSAGRWNANKDAAIQDILWGYEYVTVGDDRVRPAHQAQEGVRQPKDSPYWKIWWPPSGFNCRCSTLEIFNEDSEAETVDPPDEFVTPNGQTVTNPQPDKGWDWNPGMIFADKIAA